MCSEYHTPQNPKALEKILGVPFLDKTGGFDWGSKIHFYKNGPVLQKSPQGEIEMVIKSFPQSPMPNARLSGLGSQTDSSDLESDLEHAQVRRIYETKYWKDGFANHPVLVPMSSFTEFAYWGPEIGTAQAFRVPKQEAFVAAGIAMKPFTPKGPAFSAYSILTHTATEQMLRYHFRLIVLLKNKAAAGYLEEMSPEDRFRYVIENRYTGPLEHEKLRDMAKGWEKRVETQTHKLERERHYREVLDKNQVEG